MMTNPKCCALLELLQSLGDKPLSADNIQRLFGWGNSRTGRLLAGLQEAGLIAQRNDRPGRFSVQAAALCDAECHGFPQPIIDQVCDVFANSEFLSFTAGD